MAEKLEGYKFVGPGARNQYPWDEWLDGSAWRLMAGTDFKVQIASIRKAAMVAAHARDLKVHTAVEGDTVIIQAYSPNGTP